MFMSNAAKKLSTHGASASSSDASPANEADVFTHEAPCSHAQRLVQARVQLDALQAVWPDLVAQTTDARKASSGKVAGRMMPTLRKLFQLAATPTWAPVFNALGVSSDPEHHVPFDAAHLLARTERYEALQALHTELLALATLVSDDLLHQGAQIVAAGKPAIGLARTLARTNPTFKGKVAPILNELTAMTASARKNAEAAAVEETDVEEDDEEDERPEGSDAKPDAKPDA
jgi:hypothetical protein